jgi:hypothetical protein
VSTLEAALRQIHADLIEAHVASALVGGLAVSARTEPRFTRDATWRWRWPATPRLKL